MPLFEVAVIEMGKKKEDAERLVLAPVHVIAKQAQQAGFKAIMENQDKLQDVDEDRMEVLVRPFA